MNTKTFNVVGIAREGRTPQDILDDVVPYVQDLASHESSRRRTAAETIMHMCADILVMSNDWVDDEGMPRVTPRPAPHKRPPVR